MADLPEHGRLAETPFPRLLLDLYRARYEGALTLSRERVGKRFLFQEGAPVFAESNLASESLGVQLMDAGKISRADYNRVARHVEEKRCKEGTALLELQLIDPKGLFVALKHQVRIRIIECFGWPEGEFFVDSSTRPPDDAQPFRLDVYPLLQEGIETHWSADRVLLDLQDNMNLFPHPVPTFKRIVERLHSDEAVQALVEALDGTRTLWKAVQLASNLRAMAAAWVLDAAQALAYRDQPVKSGDPSAALESEVEIVVGERPAAAAAAPGSVAAKGGKQRAPQRDSEALAREITDKCERLDDFDYYELLGLEPDAEAGAIKRAYLKAAKIYHPDALARSGLGAKVRKQATKVFAKIAKAHATLLDPAQRSEYDASTSASGTAIDADRLAQAETLYRKGDILMKQGNFKGALEFTKPAADLWPEECAYQSAAGWCFYKKTPADIQSALQYLEQAVERGPEDHEAHFRLSVVLRAAGATEAADAALARAGELDPADG